MKIDRTTFGHLSKEQKLRVSKHAKNLTLIENTKFTLKFQAKGIYDDLFIELMEAAFYMQEDLEVFS